MFQAKTTIVLGAGASIPYGYPSGQELYEQLGRGEPVGNVEACQKALGIDKKQIQALRQRMQRMACLSIDEFLSHCTREEAELGKKLIAIDLIRREREDILFTPADEPYYQSSRLNEAQQASIALRKQRWYHQLLNLLGRTKEQIASNYLSIVTFNYDRSLEHFLTIALAERFGITLREAWQLIDHIKIIHVHGQLGPLPYQTPDNTGWPYSEELTPERVQEAANSMNVIYDERTGTAPEFNAAEGCVLNARHVVTLGFGWHPLNMRRLGLEIASDRIEGTCLGVSRSVASLIEKHLPDGSKLSPCSVLNFLDESLHFVTISRAGVYD